MLDRDENPNSPVRRDNISCAAHRRKCRGLTAMPLSPEEKVRLLSMVDVFEALSEEELERLAHLARDASYEQGGARPAVRYAPQRSGDHALSCGGGKYLRGDSHCRSGIREGTRPGVGAVFGVYPKDGGPRAADRKKPCRGLSDSAHA